MQYDHTQHAPLHYLLWAIALGQLVAACFLLDQPFVAGVLGFGAAVVALFAACFMYLNVQDEGDRLAIRYGPLPLFRKSLSYDEITEARAGRSTVIDGLGIHFVPGRGWTYNLWGFDCAELKLGEKTMRIGSDDVANLVDFLNSRIQVRQ